MTPISAALSTWRTILTHLEESGDDSALTRDLRLFLRDTEGAPPELGICTSFNLEESLQIEALADAYGLAIHY